MLRRRLARTDLHLSAIGLGCWTLGGTWWGPDQDDVRAVATIRAAVDAGVNWVDTAPLYGNGLADRLVAIALADRPDVLVCTKVGVRTDGPHATSDLTAAHVVADCEASLRRLGRDRIDLLQVHWPCERGTPLAETLEALDRLQERGDIRAYGLCNYGPDSLREAARTSRVVSLQTPLSLLRREFEGALQGAAADAGLGVLAYEALCRGLLTGKHRRPPRFSADDQRSWDPRFSGVRFAHARGLTDDLGRVAEKVGVPVAALSLGWVARKPGVTAVLAGARTPRQAVENAQAAALLGKKTLWSVVDRVAALHGGI